MHLNITLQATPSLLAALTNIAQALSGVTTDGRMAQPGQPHQITGAGATLAPEFSPAEIKAAGQAHASSAAIPFDGTDVSLEEVRAKAALLSQAGRKQEIRNLLAQYSAASISALPEKKYAVFLEALIELERAGQLQTNDDSINH